MTEQEWLKSNDPRPILDFLRGKASERKLKLFAVACRDSVRPLLNNEGYKRVLEWVEAGADGVSTLSRPDYSSGWSADDLGITLSQLAIKFAVQALLDSRWMNVPAMCARAISAGGIEQTAFAAGKASQCHLLRDIIGNPFRPVTLNPALKTPTVVQLARSLYEERRFEDMPILADALEEAGCQDAAVLGHCRGPGPHVRGCWVVDLLLGKE